MRVGEAAAVTHETAELDKLAQRIDRGYLVARHRRG
jgi:hypothetical protein